MKQISVFECDFCRKLYRSRSAITRHEKRCFKNPITKSCITCAHLSDAMLIDGKEISEHEYAVYSLEIEGTWHNENVGDNSIPTLNPEWAYLYDKAEFSTFCRGRNCVLAKLTHDCEHYKELIKCT